MAKKIKAKAPKSVEAKELEHKDVKVGRKAGTEQQPYFEMKLEQVLVNPTSSS